MCEQSESAKDESEAAGTHVISVSNLYSNGAGIM